MDTSEDVQVRLAESYKRAERTYYKTLAKHIVQDTLDQSLRIPESKKKLTLHGSNKMTLVDIRNPSVEYENGIVIDVDDFGALTEDKEFRNDAGQDNANVLARHKVWQDVHESITKEESSQTLDTISRPQRRIDVAMRKMQECLNKISDECKCYYRGCQRSEMTAKDRRHWETFHKRSVSHPGTDMIAPVNSGWCTYFSWDED